LLASQIVIIAVFGAVCRDFLRQRGFFTVPRRRLGTFLLGAGSVYVTVMVIRYVIRMSLYPTERWTGGSIPIFFHWVLAAFVLVLGAYHRRSFPGWRGTTAARVSASISWLLVSAGVVVWAAFLLAPTMLGALLEVRRPEQAVRIDRGVAMMT